MGPSRNSVKVYRVVVRGRVDPSRIDRFAGLTIEPDADSGGDTVLVGELLDQCALSGLINTLVDHRLSILRVEQLSQTDSSNPGPVL